MTRSIQILLPVTYPPTREKVAALLFKERDKLRQQARLASPTGKARYAGMVDGVVPSVRFVFV
jgi:hypothetical protein